MKKIVDEWMPMVYNYIKIKGKFARRMQVAVYSETEEKTAVVSQNSVCASVHAYVAR